MARIASGESSARLSKEAAVALLVAGLAAFLVFAVVRAFRWRNEPTDRFGRPVRPEGYPSSTAR